MSTITSTLTKKIQHTHYDVKKDGVKIGTIKHVHIMASDTHNWIAFHGTKAFTLHSTKAAAWDAINNW